MASLSKGEGRATASCFGPTSRIRSASADRRSGACSGGVSFPRRSRPLPVGSAGGRANSTPGEGLCRPSRRRGAPPSRFRRRVVSSPPSRRSSRACPADPRRGARIRGPARRRRRRGRLRPVRLERSVRRRRPRRRQPRRPLDGAGSSIRHRPTSASSQRGISPLPDPTAAARRDVREPWVSVPAGGLFGLTASRTK